MIRFLFISLVLLAGAASSAQAQNRPPVQPTRRNPTERISPVPGVELPAGVSQGKAEPVALPTQVQPNGVLPQPKLPTGEVSVDSVQVAPSPPARRPAPARRRP